MLSLWCSCETIVIMLVSCFAVLLLFVFSFGQAKINLPACFDFSPKKTKFWKGSKSAQTLAIWEALFIAVATGSETGFQSPNTKCAMASAVLECLELSHG